MTGRPVTGTYLWQNCGGNTEVWNVSWPNDSVNDIMLKNSSLLMRPRKPLPSGCPTVTNIWWKCCVWPIEVRPTWCPHQRCCCLGTLIGAAATWCPHQCCYCLGTLIGAAVVLGEPSLVSPELCVLSQLIGSTVASSWCLVSLVLAGDTHRCRCCGFKDSLRCVGVSSSWTFADRFGLTTMLNSHAVRTVADEDNRSYYVCFFMY